MVEVVRVKAGVSGAQMAPNRKKRIKAQCKPCFYDGVLYESQKALAAKLGVSVWVIGHAVKKGHYKNKKITLNT